MIHCNWCETEATGKATIHGLVVPCCDWHADYAETFVPNEYAKFNASDKVHRKF